MAARAAAGGTNLTTSAEPPLEPQPDVVLYRRRWLMLLLFALLSGLNGCVWIQFASVSALSQTFFNTSALSIDWFSIVFLVTYIPGVFAANVVYARNGLRSGLLLGATLNAVGAGLRWAGAVQRPPSFAVAMGGQLLAAMAQCLTFGAPALLAAVWFGASERATATTFGVLANQLGAGCGMLTAAIIAEGWELADVLQATAFAALAVLLVFALAFEAAPPTPPSASAAVLSTVAAERAVAVGSGSVSTEVASLLAEDDGDRGEGGSGGDSGGYAALLRNKGFALLLLSYGCLMAVNNSVSTLINVILIPSFGAEASTAASTIGFALIIAGVPGALLVGLLVGRWPRYLGAFRSLIAAATLAMAGFAAAIQARAGLSVLTFASACLGMTLAALMSTGFELGAELIFPVSAERASAMLNIANSVCSTGGINALQMLVDNNERGFVHVGWVQVAVLAVGFVCAWRCQGRLLRLEYEQRAAQQQVKGGSQTE